MNTTNTDGYTNKIRQPIVSVLGHVDHGKTSLLDNIRGTSVVSRESGKITQHIGATEVPIDVVSDLCGGKINRSIIKIPGILFIDTPGHHSFATLRSRGGALADMAILVVDINEGIKPQTIESLNLFKKYKTPFIIAANKIDRIDGWKSSKWSFFAENILKQRREVKDKFEDIIYNFIGELYGYGFPAERYDKITDFTKNIAVVPTSAKTGEGIPDILMTLIGLSQKYLENRLEFDKDIVEGTVLELKELKGLGTALDVILYNGVLKSRHKLVLTGKDEVVVTGIKAILKPKALDEIRDPKENFENVHEQTAAVGIRIIPQESEGIIVGGIFRAVDENKVEDAISYVRRASKINIDLAKFGVIIKADAIGSLEAMAYELKNADIPIFKADVGDITKRDLIDAATMENPLYKTVMGFNVKIHPEAEEELEAMKDTGIKVISSDIVYKIIEDYQEWEEMKKNDMEKDFRSLLTFPGKFKILPNHIFRMSRPAVVGVRILGGRIRVGQRVLRNDGKTLGYIKSIKTKDTNHVEANMGDEVAVAITDMVIGRNAREEDILFIDISEKDASELKKYELTFEEKEILEEVAKIKRKDKPFWGM